MGVELGNRGSGGVGEKAQRKEEWFGLKYELYGSHFVRSFGSGKYGEICEERVGEREKDTCYKALQYPAGQDGGGEQSEGGGEKEREEAQDGEMGGRMSHHFKAWPSCLPHSLYINQ